MTTYRLLFVLASLAASHGAFAQMCKPISERKDRLGCWIVANTTLGQLPGQPIYWHLDNYATRAEAEAAKGPRGTVVESLGKVWLLTIDIAGWHPSGGTRVAEIGPLPVNATTKYSAQYMEAIFTPGMTAPAHRHSGPEAWYTVAGETCLETPAGKMLGRAGGPPVIVPGGPPMHLTAPGSGPVVGKAAIRDYMAGPEGKILTIYAKGVAIWRKDASGNWHCVVDIWNEAPTPEATGSH